MHLHSGIHFISSSSAGFQEHICSGDIEPSLHGRTTACVITGLVFYQERGSMGALVGLRQSALVLAIPKSVSSKNGIGVSLYV